MPPAHLHNLMLQNSTSTKHIRAGLTGNDVTCLLLRELDQ
ncbi:hypothetical protein FB555_000503 [Alpinimonas psychrophila]|uniref:Uncharacterized protein n=1 Tax=Alpinimonas psychrophila TaxID=748908 RepID=A0A7W3JSN3_9MICO|nr:hypothetical protein [Alpinimonas psychrophila]